MGLPPYIAKNAARNRSQAALYGVVGLACGALAGMVAIVYARDPSYLAFIPVLAAGVWAFLRMARRSLAASLTIGDREVVLHGPTSTQRLALADVTCFERGWAGRRQRVFLCRRDGKRFLVWTLLDVAAVDQLNAELAARR